mmetsp:Transcript_58590/g.188321  ORF Transcript_58590/g.188321 Transcript_58590/m.188321 type:complete len:231 (-) Transcript_58590:670-1362(-)
MSPSLSMSRALKTAVTSHSQRSCCVYWENSEALSVPFWLMSKALNAAFALGYLAMTAMAKSRSMALPSSSLRRRPFSSARLLSSWCRPRRSRASALRTDIASGRYLVDSSCCIWSFSACDTSSCLAASAMSQGSSPRCVLAQRLLTRNSCRRTSQRGLTEQAACSAVQPRGSWKSGLALACRSERTACSSRPIAASTRRVPYSRASSSGPARQSSRAPPPAAGRLQPVGM